MTATSSNKNVHCKCCSNNEYKILATLHNAFIARCSNCNLTFVIKGSDIFSDEDYFQTYDLDKYVEYYQEFRNRLFKRHLHIIGQLVPKGAILDVGCSFGWFLKIARDFGWRPFGIERSEEISKLTRQTYNLNVLCGDVESANRFNTSFQVITLWNVLEHIAEPVNALKFLYNELTPGGLLVISVPNVNGLFSRIAFWSYKASWGKFKFPLEQLYQTNTPNMHLFHFSVETLGLILTKCDFEVIKVVKQQVIESRKIHDRIDMDKSLKFRSPFLKSLLISGTKLLFYLSKITNLHDEIVIYAKKSSSVSKQ